MAKIHKDKAKEIYHSMLNAGKGFTSEHLAKVSAEIMIQEFIDEFTCIIQLHGKKFDSYLDYWTNVKKELKKL